MNNDEIADVVLRAIEQRGRCSFAAVAAATGLRLDRVWEACHALESERLVVLDWFPSGFVIPVADPPSAATGKAVVRAGRPSGAHHRKPRKRVPATL